MIWTVWLDDLNPHLDDACTVEPFTSERQLRGTELHHVEANTAAQALQMARKQQAQARLMNARGR